MQGHLYRDLLIFAIHELSSFRDQAIICIFCGKIQKKNKISTSKICTLMLRYDDFCKYHQTSYHGNITECNLMYLLLFSNRNILNSSSHVLQVDLPSICHPKMRQLPSWRILNSQSNPVSVTSHSKTRLTALKGLSTYSTAFPLLKRKFQYEKIV